MADGLGRGRAAVDIELGFVAAVGAQMRGQDAAIVAGAGLLLRLQHDRAGAVAEQHAGGAVGPVEDAREGLGADHQRALVGAGAQQAVGGGEPVDEARADRLQIEGRAVGDAEPGLDRDRAGRKGVVGRRGREHDQIDRLRVDVGAGERRLRRMQWRDRRSASPVAAMWRSRMPVRCTIHSSEVSTVAREFLVGEDALRQIAAAAENNRTQRRHEAAPPTAARLPRWRACAGGCVSPILASSS